MNHRDRFSVNLRQARQAAGISQEELAERCEIHRTEVSLLERGGREPRLGTMIKLATALGTDAETLCSGIAWNPKERAYRVDDPS